MSVNDPFTKQEYELAQAVPLSKEIYAEAQRVATGALDWLAYDVMLPVINTFVGPLSDRELAISGTFFRLAGYVRSIRALAEPSHFQAVAACTRAGFELVVDVALIHKELVPDAVEKFHAFTRVARFVLAKRTVDFFEKHPDLRMRGDAEEQTKVVNNSATVTEIEALWARYWPPKATKDLRLPQHWSGLDLARRSELVGLDYLKRYRQWNDLFAWYIHSGAAGVGGMSSESLGSIDTLCRTLLQEVVPTAYRQIGKELRLDHSVAGWSEKIDVASEWALRWAVTDIRLRQLGRKSKFDPTANTG